MKKPRVSSPFVSSEIGVLADRIRGAARFLLVQHHTLADFIEKCGLHKNSVMRIKSLRVDPDGEWAWNPQVDTFEKLERLLRYAESKGYVHGVNTPEEPSLPAKRRRTSTSAPAAKKAEPAAKHRRAAQPPGRPKQPSNAAKLRRTKSNGKSRASSPA